jgi:proteasome lid subunit RPN8/RPN11
MNNSGGKAGLKIWGDPENSQVVIYIDKKAYGAIYSHGASNLKREVVGILLGDVSQDSNNKYRVDIIGVIKSDVAPGNQTQAKFTDEVWLQLVESAQRDYPNQKVVGWYHTHPGFGAFMSEDDVNCHCVAFSHPWHVAAVCDPVKNELCFFGRDGSEIKAIKGFYTYEVPAKRVEPALRPDKVAPQRNLPPLLVPVLAIFLTLFTITGIIFWMPRGQNQTPPPAPSLNASPDSLFFGSYKNQLPLQLFSIGSGTLSWQAEDWPVWLTIETAGKEIVRGEPHSITANAPVTVTATVSRDYLSPDDYSKQIIFDYGSSNKLKIPVLITVTSPAHSPAVTQSAPVAVAPRFQIISVIDTEKNGYYQIAKGGEAISVKVRNTGDISGLAKLTIDFNKANWAVTDFPEPQEIPVNGEKIFTFTIEPEKSALSDSFLFQVWYLTNNGEFDNKSDDELEVIFGQQ